MALETMGEWRRHLPTVTWGCQQGFDYISWRGHCVSDAGSVATCGLRAPVKSVNVDGRRIVEAVRGICGTIFASGSRQDAGGLSSVTGTLRAVLVAERSGFVVVPRQVFCFLFFLQSGVCRDQLGGPSFHAGRGCES